MAPNQRNRVFYENTSLGLRDALKNPVSQAMSVIPTGIRFLPFQTLSF
ncbi:hypothetical protein OSCI_1780004 [Kamptonema sp. PCC 6506]|nr:hypothetical protein OSCI_1780004 [Kamptonema sp. PCC 6506]